MSIHSSTTTTLTQPFPSHTHQLTTQASSPSTPLHRLRGTYEGSKGKEQKAWFTGKRAISKRWADFKKDRTKHGLPVVGSEGIFREMWLDHKEIHEAGAKGHPICETCGDYQAKYDRLEGRTDAAAVQLRKEADEEQEQHDWEHQGERAYAEDIWGKAEVSPDLITAFNMDAPTVSQFDIPVQKRVARDVTKRLETMVKWGSKVTGMLVAGWGCLIYLARAGLGSGANLSCTIMYLTLLELQKPGGRGTGARFNLLMDNTAGDNKNAEMVIFLGWLIYFDNFKDSSFFCQLKGHTFTVLDQSFNTLISQLLAEAIYSMSSLISFIFKFMQPYNCHEVVELHQLWDWTTFFKPHVHRMAGFCTSQHGAGAHECYIRKDREGVVRCWMRKSSRASNWMPEGEGYQVFATPPDRMPPIAKTKSDATWGRTKVEATIRAWFGLMVVEDAAQLQSIRSEWETRFTQLPDTDDPSNIDPSLRLQWRDLKSHAWERGDSTFRRAAKAADANRQISPALENPPVNPITGLGRTAADVTRETLQYQAYVRGQLGGDRAVFQADYLLVQLPGEALQLHRVASGLFIEDAMAENVAFQTLEYKQVPNKQKCHRGGFWGEFTPMVNTSYDAMRKKTGTMFKRHGEISREYIVMYDVQVVKVPKPPPAKGVKPIAWLRIHAISLRKLSQLVPAFALPCELPDSHLDDEEDMEEEDLASNEGGEEEESGEEGEEEEEEEEEEEDPPPVFPQGWREADVEPTPLTHFVLWTNVRRGGAAWSTGVVTKVYPAGYTFRGKPYTHDAKLGGGSDVRGVNLTPELKKDGYWLPIERSPGGDQAEPASEPAPAPARAPVHKAKRRRG